MPIVNNPVAIFIGENKTQKFVRQNMGTIKNSLSIYVSVTNPNILISVDLKLNCMSHYIIANTGNLSNKVEKLKPVQILYVEVKDESNPPNNIVISYAEYSKCPEPNHVNYSSAEADDANEQNEANEQKKADDLNEANEQKKADDLNEANELNEAHQNESNVNNELSNWRKGNTLDLTNLGSTALLQLVINIMTKQRNYYNKNLTNINDCSSRESLHDNKCLLRNDFLFNIKKLIFFKNEHNKSSIKIYPTQSDLDSEIILLTEMKGFKQIHKDWVSNEDGMTHDLFWNVIFRKYELEKTTKKITVIYQNNLNTLQAILEKCLNRLLSTGTQGGRKRKTKTKNKRNKTKTKKRKRKNTRKKK
jgi:hypothetical protein